MAAPSVSSVTTISLAAATSAGDFTTLAPASAKGLALSGVRFHTVASLPRLRWRPATAAPMAPNPATPIFMAPPISAVTIGDHAAAGKRHRDTDASPRCAAPLDTTGWDRIRGKDARVVALSYFTGRNREWRPRRQRAPSVSSGLASWAAPSGKISRPPA